MRLLFPLAVLLLAGSAGAGATSAFDGDLEPKTLRETQAQVDSLDEALGVAFHAFESLKREKDDAVAEAETKFGALERRMKDMEKAAAASAAASEAASAAASQLVQALTARVLELEQEKATATTATTNADGPQQLKRVKRENGQLKATLAAQGDAIADLTARVANFDLIKTLGADEPPPLLANYRRRTTAEAGPGYGDLPGVPVTADGNTHSRLNAPVLSHSPAKPATQIALQPSPFNLRPTPLNTLLNTAHTTRTPTSRHKDAQIRRQRRDRGEHGRQGRHLRREQAGMRVGRQVPQVP